MLHALLVVLASLGLCFASLNKTDNYVTLSPFKITSVTVSGISSGASMAVQVHVSFSQIISGVAAFAGGPFYCAQGTILYAETKCMAGTLGGPDVDTLVALTYSDAKLNYIDDPSNLKNDKVFVYAGLSDTVVNPLVVHSLQAYYSYFMDAGRIETSYNVNSEHCLPTLDYGEDCTVLSSPYLGNCHYDGAGAALKALYGTLQPRTEANKSRLYRFDQRPFIEQRYTSIGDLGFIYVPKACEDGAECALHVSFHGCHMGVQELGDTYAQHAGFNEWAESNNIVVLYPTVEPSNAMPYNPNGCWDWWGYTNKITYGVKTGAQPSFVRNLIKAVTGK